MWTSPVRDPGESIGTFTLPQRRSPVTGTCEDGDFGLLRLAQVDRVDRVLGRGGAFLDAGEAGVVEHARNAGALHTYGVGLSPRLLGSLFAARWTPALIAGEANAAIAFSVTLRTPTGALTPLD